MTKGEKSKTVVICGLSSWFFRRMALAFAVMLVLALYFLYDGAIGYPKQNFAADLYDTFSAARSGMDSQNHGNRYSESELEVIAAAREAGKSGSSWAAFAATRRLPETPPERFSAAQIKRQFLYAALLAVVATGIGVRIIRSRKQQFCCDFQSFTTPTGIRIDFSEVQEIDLSKWDRGIGRLKYRNKDGQTARITIDDYKFSGTGEILKRMLTACPDIPLKGDRKWLSME